MDSQGSANSINNQLRNNKYFTAEPANSNIPILGGLNKSYVKLKPKGSTSIINIVDNHSWKISGSKDEVPVLWATELELDYGVWYQNFANVFAVGQDILKNVQLDPYLAIYAASKTNFFYKFPWLLNNGSNIRTTNNTWGNMDSGGISGLLGGAEGPITKGLGAIAGVATRTLSPGVGFEEIKEFKTTQPQSITVTFPLYNTMSVEEAYDNFCFVQLFTFQNLKTRTSFMTFIPPKLYTLDSGSLGGNYIPISFVSDLKIDSIGTTRRMNYTKGNEILIPEAYKVSITFQEILPQSSNIYAGAMGGDKVQVTQVPAEFIKNLFNQTPAQ
jgi:hypothetical protein